VTAVDSQQARELLRGMLRIRRFEERCVELYSAARIRGFMHLDAGECSRARGRSGHLHADRPSRFCVRSAPRRTGDTSRKRRGPAPHRFGNETARQRAQLSLVSGPANVRWTAPLSWAAALDRRRLVPSSVAFDVNPYREEANDAD
jgi:hypothetical protein